MFCSGAIEPPVSSELPEWRELVEAGEMPGLRIERTPRESIRATVARRESLCVGKRRVVLSKGVESLLQCHRRQSGRPRGHAQRLSAVALIDGLLQRLQLEPQLRREPTVLLQLLRQPPRAEKVEGGDRRGLVHAVPSGRRYSGFFLKGNVGSYSHRCRQRT